MSFTGAPNCTPEAMPTALEEAPSTGPEMVGRHNEDPISFHDEACYHHGNHETKGPSDNRVEQQRIRDAPRMFFWFVIVYLVFFEAEYLTLRPLIVTWIKSHIGTTSTPTTNPLNSTTGSQSITSSATSSSTTAATTTSLTPAFSSGCNATNKQNFTPLNIVNASAPYEINGTVLTFTIYCDTNFADTGNNPQIHKLQQVTNLTSLEDCITACATYNAALLNAGAAEPMLSEMCTGVVFVQASPNKCDLDQGMTNGAVNVYFEPDQEIDSAVLQGFGD